LRTAPLLVGLLWFPAPFALAQTVLYSNGPYITGQTAASGAPAPGGGAWSELAGDPGGTSANKIYGFTVGSTDPAAPRVVDDFTIPPGASWNISRLRLLAFQTQTGTTSTITGVTVRIWDAPPNEPGAQVVFGDATTNRLAETSFTGVYRIQHSLIPAACGGVPPPPPPANRPIMNVYADIGHTLGPGTYWLDVNLSASLVASVSLVPTTIPMVREPNPDANAMRRANNQWSLLNDDGLGCSPLHARQELFFEVIGQGGGGVCYANCDGSTQQPVLNVADFSCFLTKFAAQHTYANCDGSTVPPVHNVADFSCFLTKFAAGCP
jgi:hypothetical protein